VLSTSKTLRRLAERQPIFYIDQIPPHAGGCGCVPVSLVEPAAASGLKPLRHFPCSDLRTFLLLASAFS
jgi:hypothetical protein